MNLICMMKCLFSTHVTAVTLVVFIINDDIHCIEIYFASNNERTVHFQEHLLRDYKLCAFASSEVTIISNVCLLFSRQFN